MSNDHGDDSRDRARHGAGEVLDFLANTNCCPHEAAVALAGALGWMVEAFDLDLGALVAHARSVPGILPGNAAKQVVEVSPPDEAPRLLTLDEYLALPVATRDRCTARILQLQPDGSLRAPAGFAAFAASFSALSPPVFATAAPLDASGDGEHDAAEPRKPN